MSRPFSRREALAIFSGASLALQLPAAQPGAPLFFTKEEFALLDCLTDMIIPTDANSPGAREAGVAAFIDKTTAEAFLPEQKQHWRKGLAPYLPLNKADRIAMLTKLAANEHHAQTDAEHFFGQLKQTTAFAYYSSNIGIHTDIQYVGNVVQEQFSGYEAT